MRIRFSTFALATLLLPAAASAQLQVLIVDGSSERPLQSFEDMGTVAAGDTLLRSFRIRNDATSAITLDRLMIAGSSFSIPSPPVLPASIAAGGSVTFAVRFAPVTAGNYSANLTVSDQSFIIRATAQPVLTVSVETGGSRQVLNAGATVDFGAVEIGSGATRRFVLENPTTATLSTSVSLIGVDFRLSGTAVPAELAAGQSASFDIVFSSQRTGASTATLQVGSRQFTLRAAGTEPPLPALQISLNPATPESGQQAGVSVTLASPAVVRVTGQLLMTFQPGVSGVPADPAVQFSSGGTIAAFEIAAGQSTATFGSDTAARLQTGTTAGTIVMTARAGSRSEEARIVLARIAPRFSSVRAIRASGSSLEVQVTAFDNTRTITRVGYTFFDTAGTQIGDTIRVDVADAFQSYFRGSAAGGAFSMKAVFPITNGDASQIGAVEAEILNGSGTGRSERTRF